jgi:predicted Rossmann fold flavoprotein
MHDAIILGAGGAGLFCAATAGQAGARVLVIDHNQDPGKKILISGGGRCNFTNVGAVPDRYLSENRHFARSALSRYTPADFVALVEKHRIAFHEKTLGQLFCDGSAKQIVALLMDECAAGGVDFAFGAAISDVRHADGRFTIVTSEGVFSAPRLVIATGGPAIPKLGATGFAYQVAKQFGLKIIPPRPALVPFTLPGTENLFRELAGVAADVVATAVSGAGKAAFREAALFTHKGLSGPAMLQVSSYWRHGEAIAVDFLPDAPANWLTEAKRQRPKSGLKSVLASALPDRLATALADRIGLPGELGNQKDATLAAAMQRLKAWAFRPDGTEGFAKAEVTAGGIDTAGLSSRTMAATGAANHIGGLFAIGEAVDVTGWLGGYNFQWAWASGFAAGQAIAQEVQA